MEAKRKILVVDDHKTVHKLMEAVLKLRGYKVLYAEDGSLGIEVARREKPDLIFLDVMMPGLDGFKVCQYLKEDPATRHIPVVFLTARGEETDVAMGKRVGGDDFVKKPFKTAEIMELLGRLVPAGGRAGL